MEPKTSSKDEIIIYFLALDGSEIQCSRFRLLDQGGHAGNHLRLLFHN